MLKPATGNCPTVVPKSTSPGDTFSQTPIVPALAAVGHARRTTGPASGFGGCWPPLPPAAAPPVPPAAAPPVPPAVAPPVPPPALVLPPVPPPPDSLPPWPAAASWTGDADGAASDGRHPGASAQIPKPRTRCRMVHPATILSACRSCCRWFRRQGCFQSEGGTF